MEKYTMFMDQKNQYSENEYTTQSNLQIQCNPYQATNGIFQRTRTNNFTICMEIQKKKPSNSLFLIVRKYSENENEREKNKKPNNLIAQCQIIKWASQMVLVIKNPSANTRRCKRCRFDPWVGKNPWGRKRQPIPVFLPGKSQGLQPVRLHCKESDMTEHR